MDKKDFIKQLDIIFEDNCKILSAIDNGKNINIHKAIKASLISNNRTIQVITNILKEYYFEHDEDFNDYVSKPKSKEEDDKNMDILKNMFGFK